MVKRNPVVRGWKYMSAWLDRTIDEKADPRVQIEQAVAEAQRQHQALTTQAAAVIGNQRQLEMQLDRQLNAVENLQAQTRQALSLADEARAAGDVARAGDFEQTAQALANQLVAAEAGIEDTKALHDRSLGAAEQAREAVRTNKSVLERRLAERSALLSQLEQAKMQETVSRSLQQMNELAAPSNVPTLEEIRDKIERRYATALGEAEIANDSTGARLAEVKRATVDRKGAARLAEIRAAMEGPTAALPASGPGAITDAGATGGDARATTPVDTTKRSGTG